MHHNTAGWLETTFLTSAHQSNNKKNKGSGKLGDFPWKAWVCLNVHKKTRCITNGIRNPLFLFLFWFNHSWLDWFLPAWLHMSKTIKWPKQYSCVLFCSIRFETNVWTSAGINFTLAEVYGLGSVCHFTHMYINFDPSIDVCPFHQQVIYLIPVYLHSMQVYFLGEFKKLFGHKVLYILKSQSFCEFYCQKTTDCASDLYYQPVACVAHFRNYHWKYMRFCDCFHDYLSPWLMTTLIRNGKKKTLRRNNFTRLVWNDLLMRMKRKQHVLKWGPSYTRLWVDYWNWLLSHRSSKKVLNLHSSNRLR